MIGSCVLAVLGVLLLLAADSCVERFLLRVRKETLTVPHLPDAWDGLRIVQVSDLHHARFGKNQARLVRAVRACQPAYIFLTGDLISRDQLDFSELQAAVTAWAAIAPVFFVTGNHELDLAPDVREQYLEMLRSCGVQVLENASCILSRNQQPLCIAGATLDRSVYHDGSYHYRNLAGYSPQQLTRAIGPHTMPTILLAHNPLLAKTYQQWGAELTLSGHVHGGMVRLPLLGGLLSPERRFLPAYEKGAFVLSPDSILYVSGGLAKPRLWNPPEINCLTLRSGTPIASGKISK